MKINSTKSILVIIALALAGFVLLNYFVFVKIFSNNREAAELNAQAAEYEARKNELSGKGGEGDVSTLTNKIDSYFIENDGVVGFIEGIENEARNENVSLLIRSVDSVPLDPEQKGSIEKVVLKIEARASWKNLLQFIAYLEHIPYKVLLRAVDLSVYDGSTGPENDLKKIGDVPMWKARIEFEVLKHV